MRTAQFTPGGLFMPFRTIHFYIDMSALLIDLSVSPG